MARRKHSTRRFLLQRTILMVLLVEGCVCNCKSCKN
jgi:hypothetical protein